MPSRYDGETKAKAVRLVKDHVADYETEWAAITAVSAWLGMSAETLRKWIRQSDVDAGKAPGCRLKPPGRFASSSASAESWNRPSRS